MQRLQQKLDETGIGRIASVTGRYYAMDRDHRWDRVALAYRCLTGLGTGAEPRRSNSANEAIEAYYRQPTEAQRSGDEFIVPTRIGGLPTIGAGDGVIFFNFRGDRPREITKAFVLPDEEWAAVKGGGFDRGDRLQDLYFCTMTGYEQDLPVTAIAFERPPKMVNILGQVIADAGLSQFRCAETEKYPHVTFFFNDYREEPFEGEHRVLVPSPRDVSTYDQKPEMSAADVCAAVLARLE